MVQSLGSLVTVAYLHLKPKKSGFIHIQIQSLKFHPVELLYVGYTIKASEKIVKLQTHKVLNILYAHKILRGHIKWGALIKKD